MRFFKNLKLGREVIKGSLNIRSIFVFLYVWTYGFYGFLDSGHTRALFFKLFFSPALIDSADFIHMFWLIVLTLGLAILLYFFKGPAFDYKIKITIKLNDILIAVLYFVFLFCFSFKDLFQSLSGDELYHAMMSQKKGMGLLKLLAAAFPVISNATASHLLWVINILGLAAVSLLIFLIYKYRIKIKPILIILFFFLSLLIATPDIHPPFRLFPLWLSSCFFGVTDFAFRIPQLIALVVFGVFSQKLTKKIIGEKASFLFGLAVISVPVFWHIGLILEQSIWTVLCWSVVLIKINYDHPRKNDEFIWLGFLILVFSLMRQTAFISLLPYLAALCIYIVKNKEVPLKILIFNVKLFILLSPFVIHTLVNGTPASYLPEEVFSFIPSNLHLLERLFFVVNSGLLYKMLLPSISFFWTVMFLFALILNRNKISFFLTVSFFIFAFIMFYSIRPILWGVGRYQAELFIPFSILGFLFLILLLKEKKQFLVIPLLCSVIILNTFLFLKIPNSNKPVDILKSAFYEEIKKGNVVILSELFYDYRDALKAVNVINLNKHVYLYGSVYGYFPQLIAGYKMNELVSIDKINQSVLNDPLSKLKFFQSVNGNQDIKVVLISDLNEKEITNYLLSMGWSKWIDFKNTRWGSTIFGLTRENLIKKIN